MTIHLLYPVSGPITQAFGANPDLYKKWGFPGHNGIDFGVANGTPVKAAAEGVVNKVSFENGGYGNYVKLQHSDGDTTYYTYYAHLMKATVSPGQHVNAGDVIAYSNNTGASTGPHLHFGLRIEGQNPSYKGYVDPMPYLSATIPSEPSADFPGAVDLPEGMDFVVDYEVLNVRSGPGITYAIIGQLKKGDLITGKRLHSQSVWVEFESGKWCALSFDGVQYLKVK
ncbi:MAG: hypothetical protein D6770_05380 [Anaerolineae bacterium]|nr:MAG: hypothetical protein D6770_05380 [Anaerolineae bacterium]